jgi:predicted polyphosphate/ATP-dependent NAD kinase
MNIGLIVNPIAGMGGAVGLKGTDGTMYRKAVELGARPKTPNRTKEFLSHIRHKEEIELFVAPGKMGETYVKERKIHFAVIGRVGKETSAEDTKRIAQKMLTIPVDLLIFVGGDGTARDIYDAVGSAVPCVAVPAGVKIFSSVFATSARAAAELVDSFIEGTNTTEKEVLDIDEASFRNDKLSSKRYGYLQVPDVVMALQGGKESSQTGTSIVENKEEIARYVVETLDAHTLYLLGPGTTVRAITTAMGLPKTLLGVDALVDNKLVGTDINEREILRLFQRYEKRKIIVTPIGGNGFIFGRGNKQFTPRVLKTVGRENILIVGNKTKIATLDSLRMDTGDEEADRLFCGYAAVITDYKEEMVMEVKY